ncbi:alpha/beta hydrolase [Klebsiella pneumoniae]|nr:alpha/beta hydrolase [Klebsiella pneumoniae]
MAYDLFHCGFDVRVIDHRGRDAAAPALRYATAERVNFSDYVDDLAALWQQQVVLGHWETVYPCSFYGRSDLPPFSATLPGHCDAIALCAPMFGIIIRLPDWMCAISRLGLRHQRIREE